MNKETTKITQDQFDAQLLHILKEEPMFHILNIPGIYEILSEHYNNEVLEALRT